MAPKRRLFQPPVARDELLSLSFTPPPEKPKVFALEDELRQATEEPDDDLALAKMAKLLSHRGAEVKEKWGEDTYAQVAETMRKQIAAKPMQQGVAAPNALNMLTGRDQPGAAARDLEGFIGNVSEIPTLPAQMWEHYGVQPIPADQLRYGNRAEAAGRTFVSGVGQALTAIPDIGVGLGTMAGTGIAALTGGAPSGPGVMQQGAAAVQPLAAAGEYMTSAPAIAMDLVGGDPNSLPGVLARSEQYLTSLYGRAAETPVEPAFGALMAGGLGRGAIKGKRRLFGSGAPEAAGPPTGAPMAPDAAQALADIRFSEPPAQMVPDVNDISIGSVTDSAGPVQPRAIQAQQVPGVAEGRAVLAPSPEAAPPQPAIIDRRAATNVPDEIPAPPQGSIVVQPGSRPRAVDIPDAPPEPAPPAPGMTVVDRRSAPPVPEAPAPALVEPPPPTPVAPEPAKPAARKAPEPEINTSDVDAMIEAAKARETTITETQVAPGKRRLSIRGPGPGRVRPTGRGSRGRGGAVAVPSLAEIRNNVKKIGSDIAGWARGSFASRPPRPAPAPGAPGGPGSGVPFRVEPLRPTLTPVAAPGWSVKRLFENVAHPSAKGSWWERTGINAMATQVGRIANTFDLDTVKFLFGDDQGRVWLREQFQKAGRDLWSAVVTFREGGELSAAEQAAIGKHRQIFDQFVQPAFRFLDHVRQQNVFRDLGATYWPYDWGTIADINSLLGDERPGWTPGKGVGPDKVRTTTDAPLRNPVDVIDGYRAALRDKLTRRQMLQQLEEFVPKLDERGKQMVGDWVNGTLFNQAGFIDTWWRKHKIGNALKDHPKPGETFPLDGAFELDGELRVIDEAYESPTRGQTYNVEIDGRQWPVPFSGPELAAFKMGKRFPSPKPVSAIVNGVNKAASYNAIAGNMRSLWRQLMGGQARFIAEAEVGDFSYGHGRAAEYFRGTMPEADLRMLREAGVLDGETSVQGLDLAKSSTDKILFSNVYVPDTATKVAAWFSEWNRLGRENPSMPREARMDAATSFALRVSDLNLSLVQAPWGNSPGVALGGLFNKSRLRELRHVANMSGKQAAKYAGTTGAALAGMAVLGALNKDEMKSVLWSALPFGEITGDVLQKAGLPGGAANRHGNALGAAGVDIAAGYAPAVLGESVKLLRDLAKGRELGSTARDAADEADSRMRRVFPLKAAYRTGSDLVRATLADSEARNRNGRDVSPARAAWASMVTAPQPPYQTEYQKERSKERAEESRESGSHSSGGRRGNRKRRLFQGL